MRQEYTWQGENGEQIVRTCAWSPPGCHPVGCGLLLHVKDGKLVKVEGDPEHPITRGALCPRCLALKDFVYHPDRLLHPMKRAKEYRGQDKWEQCSWDEAYDIICTNARSIIEEYGRESIVVFGGTGRVAAIYYPNMATEVFGTPNACYAQSGFACYYPRVIEMIHLVGGGYPEVDYAAYYPDRYEHEGWEPPKYILVWGKEPLKSNGDGFWGHSIVDLMKLGSKVIHVDPRVTWLGSRADMVLQLRPGTDGALAMALCNVVIEEDLYDHDFVSKWVYGFEDFAARCAEMTPEKAEEITWVPADEIREAARKFANGHNSTMCWGLAIDQNPNGGQIAQCLIGLIAITGNLDVPGGCTIGGVEAAEEQARRYFAAANNLMTDELWEKRIGKDDYPGICDFVNRAHPDKMIETLTTGDPYQIHMAFFYGSNVAGGAVSANPNAWIEGLKKLDFMCSTEVFMTVTTMELCDVVLPLSSTAEADGFLYPHYGQNSPYYGAINKALTVGDTKGDLEILVDLGHLMNPDFWNQFADPIDYMEKIRIPNNMPWEQFRANGVTQQPYHYKKYETGGMRFDHQPGFNTSTGRIELYCYSYEKYGEDPLPYYKEPPISPISTPDLFEQYPMVLTSGSRTYVSFHSEHRQIKSLREMHPWPLLEINPKDAEELGIKDGDWVWIENQFGRCTQKAHIVTTIKPGVVHAEHAWWYPEQEGAEPSLFGNQMSNINVCMPNGYVDKLGMGDLFKAILCKVYKNDDPNAIPPALPLHG